MNKQLRRLGLGLILCYALLFVQLNWLQVVKADGYNKDPNNTRAVVRDFTRPRGLILTADGQVLAQSVPAADRYKELRQYPLADLFGEVTGYFSFKYAPAGLEPSTTTCSPARPL